ncbi:MAG: hypothetical protein IJI06_02385 [Oscillospiraceae bacterium]|nr:hypothetical protein [Oscillospiraceae bacterium]
MKYLVIEIQKFEDGKMSTPAYAFDNINSAEAKYHAILSAAAVSALPVHSAVLLNETGFCIKSQSYDHTPEPEPEPETDA